MNAVSQSLAGRIATAKLLPLSLSELEVDGKSDSVSLIYQGFYPRIHQQQLDPTDAMSFYMQTYVERDVRTLLNIKDLSNFERFVRLCAANIGQLIVYSRFASDLGIDQKTVKSWLSLLEASYIIFRVKPHYKNFRKRLTKSDKLYFYDIGLASYLLGITKKAHVLTHPLQGNLFENLVIADILKQRYNRVRDNNLYFFRDHVGKEVDLVLDYGHELSSVEIKSAKTYNQEFRKHLDYYHRLCPELNRQRFIVYNGDVEQKVNGLNLIPFSKMGSLIDRLE